MVKLYTLPVCGICKVIKSKLVKKNIPFEEIQDLADFIEKYNIDHFPVLLLEDNTLLTSPKEINDWINIQ